MSPVPRVGQLEAAILIRISTGADGQQERKREVDRIETVRQPSEMNRITDRSPNGRVASREGQGLGQC